MAVKHGTLADGTFSAAGQTAWDEDHTIEAGTITTTELGGDITVAGKALLDDAAASNQRTTLGLGTAALSATGDFDAVGSAAAAQAASQPLDADLTTIAANITAAGHAILDDANAGAQLVTLGFAASVTELNYTDGVTSAIQGQIDGKQASDADLTAIAALTSAANKMPYSTGAQAWALADVSANARALLAASTASPVRGFIRGGLVTRSSATAIAVSACDYWDDTTGAIVSYAGGTNSPTLGVSLLYSVFLANGAIEVFQEDPPSTAYAGTARKRATGNGGRFIGWFLSNASSQIYSMEVVEIANAVKVVFKETTSSAPFRVLSGGTSTSYAAVSLLGCVPRYATAMVLVTQYLNYTTTAGDGLLAELSLDGTNRFGAVELYVPSTGAFPNLTTEIPMERSVPQLQYKLSVRGSASGPSFYLDISGFTMTR